jgi:1-acyl-sn-glycerol-3-phosphate acyltransferase
MAVRVLLTAWLLVLLAWLGVISLTWNFIAFLLKFVLRGGTARRVGRAGIAYGYRFYWACARASGLMRLEAESLDVLRDAPGGVIIAANHPSLLDALMIIARLPRSACIMKGALMRNPFLGAGAGLAGYVVNDSTRTMIRTSVERWTKAASWWCFPRARAVPRRGRSIASAAASR